MSKEAEQFLYSAQEAVYPDRLTVGEIMEKYRLEGVVTAYKRGLSDRATVRITGDEIQRAALDNGELANFVRGVIWLKGLIEKSEE